MNMWCHLPTSLGRRRLLLIGAGLSIVVAFITTLIFLISTAQAATTTNRTMAFQGRLLTAAGAVVPDGYYNMQFKIYQGGTGTAAGNPGGELKWTETRTNNGTNAGVQVKSGFFSVTLGSTTPFGSSIDWDSPTLWLSMNIAGSDAGCSSFGAGACTADGEMLPMKQMTATPYAINAGHLGGISADGFIRNTGTVQDGSIDLSGHVQATTLQGNTSIITPLIDATASGNLAIGTVNADTITIGSVDSEAQQTINIGTGLNSSNINIGNDFGTGLVTLQGGTQGVRIETNGGFVVYAKATGINAFTVGTDGSTDIDVGTIGLFNIRSSNTNQSYFSVTNNGNVIVHHNAILDVSSNAIFQQGITLQNTMGNQTYVTPNGYNMKTLINIPNYAVDAYSSIIAFGLPSTSSATARGILVADARTTAHQATIGVLSPDENNILGFSWNGSNTTASVSTTGNTISLQGGNKDLITATNSNGQARVGIGNSASSGYALDVTGDTNTSSQYRINGTTALTDSSLNFGNTSTPTTISTAASSLAINVGGQTRASFNSSNIQIGDGSAGSGDTTLLTLDQATAAPGGAALGSMYYDTTKGKVQCFEADGWGACSDAPDTFVSLAPEFAGSVEHGTDVGTMTTGFCSDSLNLNDGSSSQPTICSANETFNYYKWTSAEITSQSRSIFVTHQLPSNFKNFVTGSTSLMGRTDSANSSVTYQIYRNNSGGLSPCSTAQTVATGSSSTWQKHTATSAADPANCSFAAGDSIVFRIDASTSADKNAYISNLNFAFSNQ